MLPSPRGPLYISSTDAELVYGQLLGSSSQPQQGQPQGTALTVWRSGMSAQEEDLQQVGVRAAASNMSVCMAEQTYVCPFCLFFPW